MGTARHSQGQSGTAKNSQSQQGTTRQQPGTAVTDKDSQEQPGTVRHSQTTSRDSRQSQEHPATTCHNQVLGRGKKDSTQSLWGSTALDFLPPEQRKKKVAMVASPHTPYQSECRCLSDIQGQFWGLFGTEGTLCELHHNTGVGYTTRPDHLLSWGTAKTGTGANLGSKDMVYIPRSPSKFKESRARHHGCRLNIRSARSKHSQIKSPRGVTSGTQQSIHGPVNELKLPYMMKTQQIGTSGLTSHNGVAAMLVPYNYGSWEIPAAWWHQSLLLSPSTAHASSVYGDATWCLQLPQGAMRGNEWLPDRLITVPYFVSFL